MIKTKMYNFNMTVIRYTSFLTIMTILSKEITRNNKNDTATLQKYMISTKSGINTKAILELFDIEKTSLDII